MAQAEANLQTVLRGVLTPFVTSRLTPGTPKGNKGMSGGIRVQARHQEVVVHLVEVGIREAEVLATRGAPDNPEEMAKMGFYGASLKRSLE